MKSRSIYPFLTEPKERNNNKVNTCGLSLCWCFHLINMFSLPGETRLAETGKNGLGPCLYEVVPDAHMQVEILSETFVFLWKQLKKKHIENNPGL